MGVSMRASRSYEEYVPPGLLSVWHAARPLGFGLSGLLGDDEHRYGAHLSQARLVGTGHPQDYTLIPPPAAAHYRAGAAIDLGTGPVGEGPSWAGEWLEDVRARCATGEIGFIGEIIGDPDLILGAGSDTHVPLYATAPSWAWAPYRGTGHVAWCHLWIRRDRLGDVSLGSRLFAGWSATGRTTTGRSLTMLDIEKIVRGMTWTIPGHTYTRLADILSALSKVVDTLASREYHQRLIEDTKEAVLADLRNPGP